MRTYILNGVILSTHIEEEHGDTIKINRLLLSWHYFSNLSNFHPFCHGFSVLLTAALVEWPNTTARSAHSWLSTVPWRLRCLLDRGTHQIAPLRPGAVVISHVRIP